MLAPCHLPCTQQPICMSCACKQCRLSELCGLHCTQQWIHDVMCLWTVLALWAMRSSLHTMDSYVICLWTTLASWGVWSSLHTTDSYMCACEQHWFHTPVNSTGFMCLWTALAWGLWKQHWLHVPVTVCFIVHVPVNNPGVIVHVPKIVRAAHINTASSPEQRNQHFCTNKMTSPQVLDVGEGADAQRLGVTAHSIEVPCGVESHCADGLDILQRRHGNKPGLASAASL